MTLALRACLLASAAAGMTACATNPPLQPADIIYRGHDPAAQSARRTPQPLVMTDSTSPVLPSVRSSPAPAIGPSTPDISPYQIVADLGPSTGLSAADEARAMAPESGGRPGGARRLPQDDPANRAVEVRPGDTLYDISRRYNVNMRALIETNRLEAPYRLDAGAMIYLPPPNIHVVQKGETLYSVSRRYNVDTRSLALLNGMARPWTIWPGDELLLPPLARDQWRAPARPVSVTTPVPQVVQAAPFPTTSAASTPSLKPVEPTVSAAPPPIAANGPISLTSTPAPPKAGPRPSKPEASAAPAPADRPAPPKPQQTAPQGPVGSREFIWPVSGKVIKGFGPSADGQRNDGVNISAAKGADIRAAATGEVVYAGSELAGFGNLVLIRHPGGWVTAYAHADAILVTEGELVKQGQVIAKVGSTGNAASPQVHFELRKGKEPVDPTGHLPPLKG